MADIKGILERAETAKPIAERNGRKLMSYDDYRSVATASNINNTDLGGLELNPDGSLARTKGDMAAVNLDDFYNNRYKKVKNKYYVVIDKRAIDDVSMGRACPYQQVQAYLIGEKDGAVVAEKPVMISDKDFIADFTHKLDHASMAIVLDAISKLGVEAGTDKLEF